MHLLCQYASDLPILEDEVLAAPPDDALSAANSPFVWLMADAGADFF
jgi:hypothetical protein